jgi:sugar lactone lactonase YvrE
MNNLLSLLIAGLMFRAMGVRAATMIYVSNYDNGTIEQFTAQGVGSVFATAFSNSTVGLTCDNVGNLYAGDYGSGVIRKFTPDGVRTFFTTVPLGSGVGLTGLASDGLNIYAAVFGTGNIFRINPGGVITSLIGNVDHPEGLAIDSFGNLFVSAGNNQIVKFTPAGERSIFASADLLDPTGMAFDNAGNLYVANFLSNRIQKFTSDGSGSLFASTGLNRPDGLAFDGEGNLYAVNSGNESIEKFTPDGIGSVFATTGLDNPGFIVIRSESVPEPDVFGLLGIGTLFFVHRRKR